MSARKFVPAIPASQARTDAGPYSNPFADFQRAADRLLGEIARPSFLFPRTEVPRPTLAGARYIDRVLAARREEEREEQRNDARREQDDADALADAIEAGDLDADGQAIPYARYHGGV